MKRMIDDSVLFGIAEAIREKTDSTETFEVTEMAQAISEISSGDNSTLIDLIERDITEIIIPDGVTKIGNYAFYKYGTLTDVTIPDSVTSIGGYAFYDCTGLANITIGNGVTAIQSQTFRNCTSLTSITIPGNVKRLWDTCFYQCVNLKTVNMSNGVNYIGTVCFSGCTNLTTITLPNTIATLTADAFNGCTKLANITLEQGFNCSLNVSVSTKYTATTLVAMLEALADLTGQTAKTLTIGSTNLAKLTDEQKAIATNKNWTLA